jgi:hypothetical protein
MVNTTDCPVQLELIRLLPIISGTLSFFFFFTLLGFELRAYTLSHSTSPSFVVGFFELGPQELFA